MKTINNSWKFTHFENAGIHPIWNTTVDHSPNFEWIIQQIFSGINPVQISRALKEEKGEAISHFNIRHYIKNYIPKKYLMSKSQYRDACQDNPCLELLDEYLELTNIYKVTRARVDQYVSKEFAGQATIEEIQCVERGLEELARLLFLMFGIKARLRPISDSHILSSLPRGCNR